MIRHFIPVSLIAASLLCSCAPEPSISLDKNSFEISSLGDTLEVTVTSNYIWTAFVPNIEEITVTPPNGSSGMKATIIVQENTDATSKVHHVTFSTTSSKTYMKEVVTITQGCALPAISAVASSGTIDYKGGSIPVSIQSNFPWTASFEGSDLSVTPSGGAAGSTTADIVIKENRSDQAIFHVVSFVSFNSSYSDTSIVNILQEIAPEPYISVNPSSKTVSPSGESFNAVVSSNYRWTATASDGITLSSGGGEGGETVTIAVGENTEVVSKEFTVEFVTSFRGIVARDTLNIYQPNK